MNTIWQDIRYSVRLLLRHKVVTLVALIALALGIGANTAIFSVINVVLLKGLPYKDADRLVFIWEKLKQVDQVELAPSDYAAYSERSHSFAQIAATRARQLQPDRQRRACAPRRTAGNRKSVSRRWARAPLLGRTFTDEEDRANARVAVLSYSLWHNRFSSDPQVVGREIALDGRNYTVIGVMPAEFLYPAPINNSRPGEIWTPRSLVTERQRHAHNLLTIGRLRPGVSWEQARAEFDGITSQRAQESGQGR